MQPCRSHKMYQNVSMSLEKPYYSAYVWAKTASQQEEMIVEYFESTNLIRNRQLRSSKRNSTSMGIVIHLEEGSKYTDLRATQPLKKPYLSSKNIQQTSGVLQKLQKLDS